MILRKSVPAVKIAELIHPERIIIADASADKNQLLGRLVGLIARECPSMQRLCDTGIGVMEQAVRLAGEGKVQRLPQQGEPSYAPLFKTADSILDFSKPAAQVHSKVRGMSGDKRQFAFGAHIHHA